MSGFCGLALYSAHQLMAIAVGLVLGSAVLVIGGFALFISWVL